jgi:hypothetical protein
VTAPPAIVKVSERQFQRAVLDYAQRFGWLSVHFHDSRRQVRRASGEVVAIGDKAAAGFPDLTLTRDGVLVLAELKAEKGRLRPSQRVWLDALALVAEGAPDVVKVRIWTPRDWDDVELTLGRRA